MGLKVTVEAEEDIYTFQPADNGAGPLWCHGSTLVARQGDQVHVAGLETVPGRRPLNNCRWLLFSRDDAGWRLSHRDATGYTREPSPLVQLGNGELLVSANPTLNSDDTYSGPARPTVFRFSGGPPTVEHPVWRDQPTFTEHSYRTFVADGPNCEALYMQNLGMEAAHLSLRTADGVWTGLPPLVWPRAGDQPLRLCYPNVILQDRQAHFLGVGDIVEPVSAWKEAKLAITGRQWDYVFRRLFYAWTPDILNQPFGPWIELANLDATAGHIKTGDIWLGPDQSVHLLWTATSTDARLRQRFFADTPLSHTLEYRILDQGRTRAHHTLAQWTDGADEPQPLLARAHRTADGTPVILASWETPAGPCFRAGVPGTRINWVDVPLAQPPSGTFMTNTGRAGSAPDDRIDLVAMSPRTDHTLAYARLLLHHT